MSSAFTHLHVHSEYSLVDGIIRVPQLVAAVRDAGMPAVALTDQGNLFAAVKFYRAAIAAGIKPILGASLRVAREQPESGPPDRLLLLCQDRRGYHHLCQLISSGYSGDWQQGQPVVSRADLIRSSAGLIALSAGSEGEINRLLRAGQTADAEKAAAFYQGHFPQRFYLELQRLDHADDEAMINALCALASAQKLPVVATNAVRFLQADDFALHELRYCIQSGYIEGDARRPRPYSERQYLSSPEEMAQRFADLPEALENSMLIAQRCNLEPFSNQPLLPSFALPAGEQEDDHVAKLATAGLQRLGKDKEAAYSERLQQELAIIQQMHFSGYFLIVADFINWARQEDIPVGPGRGSGAGSLVAYALGITEIDPLLYELLFERFLNPERVSLPDFDIDFCMDGRDRVIDYVRQKYGVDRVAQIITFGTMAARAVVRDVGRALGHPYGFVDRLAKLIPFAPGMTLAQAQRESEALVEYLADNSEAAQLVATASKLEGLVRNAGRHAGGVVIAPSPLTDFLPLYSEQSGAPLIAQFDKGDLEDIGLVKFDFLGLRTLTIIQRAVTHINALQDATQPALDIRAIALDDKACYRLIQQAKTTAVFQLESHGMRDLLRRFKPDNFEQIIAQIALFRPGPLQSGMVDDMIARKHGRVQVSYLHASLQTVLQPTYGIILYQEQVMQIARVMAGYSLGQADLLRSAMGKKKHAEMARQRSLFVAGAKERGITGSLASEVFTLMEKFAGYGFNKSHSASYALLSYQTAWLKCHHAAAFMAAVLSCEMDATDRLYNNISECRRLKIMLLPPDINHSEYGFRPLDKRRIRYGLGALKGAGQRAIDSLLAERQQGGAFAGLFDLCRRVDVRQFNKRLLECFIMAGCFDTLESSRSRLMAQLPAAIQAAQQGQRDQGSGQNDLFGAGVQRLEEAVTAVSSVAEWNLQQTLEYEHSILGLYLSRHPIDRYQPELPALVSGRLDSLVAQLEKQRHAMENCSVVGLITAIRFSSTVRSRRAFVTVDDHSGRLELYVDGPTYNAAAKLLVRQKILFARGTLKWDSFSGGGRLFAEQLLDIDSARSEKAVGLRLRLHGKAPDVQLLLPQLQRILATFDRGDGRIWIDYGGDAAAACFELGPRWRRRPSDALLEKLAQLLGHADIDIVYRDQLCALGTL